RSGDVGRRPASGDDEVAVEDEGRVHDMAPWQRHVGQHGPGVAGRVVPVESALRGGAVCTVLTSHGIDLAVDGGEADVVARVGEGRLADPRRRTGCHVEHPGLAAVLGTGEGVAAYVVGLAAGVAQSDATAGR